MALARARPAAALLLAVTLAMGFSPVEGWTSGRATFYDDNNEGACRYGDSIPRYYAAWPDGQSSGIGHCGECYKVRCKSRNFRDGFGDTLEREDACRDTSASVIVKIVDSCPCVHANYYSNQRWCCGDMQHIDLGRAAFKKLAAEHHGVIGVEWRQVSCPSGYETANADEKKAQAKSTSSSSSSSRSRSRSRSSSNSFFRWFGRK